MKRLIFFVLTFFLTLIPAFSFSEIDDVASIEAQTKGEYKKIDKDFYLKGIKVFDQLEFIDEDKELASQIYNDFEKEYYFQALEKIDNLTNTDEKKILKALIYASFNMMNSAEDLIKDIDNPVLDTYKGSLHRKNKVETLPFYGLLNQDLNDKYDLDYQKWGINTNKNIKDAKVELDYKMIQYTSSNKSFDGCLVNYLKLSTDARPDVKWEYRASIAGKFFEQNGTPLLLGDAWVKYHFNDFVSMKIGVVRDSVEQSYITAVGSFIDNDFTGRAGNNKIFLEGKFRMKKDFYASFRGNAGLYNANNLPENFYFSGYFNIGKRIYNNPHNPYLQKIDFDVTSYNMGFRDNLLNIYGQNGAEYGGYFSPRYYNATSFNIRFEGEYKKLSYGLKGFIGEQISSDENIMEPTFGISPYIKFKINNRLYLKATYTFSEFANIKSNLFAIGLLIRL